MLAKKIVDMDYEKIEPGDTSYSNILVEFIDKCFIYDEDKRPSILELLTFITP